MRRSTRLIVATLLLASAGCSLQPFKSEPEPAARSPAPAATGGGPVISEPPPVAEPGTAEPVIEVPPPAPLPRERPKAPPAKLSPASQALVAQAQSQRKKGDLPGATVALERALRIEPSNPLLWIEMGRLRMDQKNYAQAEAMGRKALSMAVGDSRTQSQAWVLIAESLKARGKNPQAQDALAKARELSAY
jgi:hypothetical protein